MTTCCGIFMVQCVKLKLGIFEFGVLTVSFIAKCNWRKSFTRYGHYAGEMEDTIRQTRSCLVNRYARN